MPRREDPKITIPAGQIIAYFPGANVVETEEQVTCKVEEYLFRFNEVDRSKTISTTTEGLSVITVWLKENIRQPDIFWNKLKHELMVVKSLHLPGGVRGPILNSDFGDTEAIVIAITGDHVSYQVLKNAADRLSGHIRLIPEASKIKLAGLQREQFTVEWDPAKLTQYGISPEQTIGALQSQTMISPTGQAETGKAELPLHASLKLKTIDDIRNQMVGATSSGAVVRLQDIARLSREMAKRKSKITVNGQEAVLLTIQMHEGYNIVQFGQKVQQTIQEVAQVLPENIRLTTLVNQPEVVQQNVNRFLREFLMAIAAVILVVFLLLPLNIAAVAAAAIPMTVSVTFALLHAIGVELHQVSLAALIMVLGIVVDDAIIIADNYVELLDRGHDRWNAAWRSATELVIPVLTATVTIIAAFLPMVILTGTIGEFIHALPVTVSIALASSFLVAMFLTPMLCYLFIGKGLKSRTGSGEIKERKTFLNFMQKSYNRSLDWCVRHSRLTIAISLLTIVLAGWLYKTGLRQRFFPEAERNQFTVELWMPTGTKLEQTEASVRKIEKFIREDRRVKDYATFTGQSSPRFYYNYSPEYPAANFAQILVNTTDYPAALSLHQSLTTILDSLVPEGRPHARMMMQGQPQHAPVEIRIRGEELYTLFDIGNNVKEILLKANGSALVRTSFKEDAPGYSIRLNQEAERLGFTSRVVAQGLFTATSDLVIASVQEGEEQIDIVLRAEHPPGKDPESLYNAYLRSPVTGVWVPLRQIAVLHPEWYPGRIQHRNGFRTLTIQSETGKGVLASELVKEVKPEIEKLRLPPGYNIEFGGEHGNKSEVTERLAMVMLISLIIIGVVLLFQFRNLKEAGLVMLTIPLSLFGAIAGLIITGNDIGFTGFIGLISLSGIVVRNAIILIDHANELIEKGMPIPEAAVEAGKRRLRPIFLTAAAAAIGVWPMILSGSQLWSPTASVIAFGVLWGMVISTLAVPVMYMKIIRFGDKKGISVEPDLTIKQNKE
jgi:multidrug efflux pump subunit AcrB